MIEAQFRASPRGAARLVRAVAALPVQDGAVEGADRVLRWALQDPRGSQKRLRILCAEYARRDLGILLVNSLAALPIADARRVMRAFFAAGGTMASVNDWLSIAGGTVPVAPQSRRRAGAARRTGRATRRDLLGAIGGAISGAASAVANLAASGVSTVVDAVVSAGKSIGDAVSAAANWTASKTADLVKGLVKAGKSVASILEAALKKNLLAKFVRAALDAGRALGEVLAWAVQKSTATIRSAVQAALAAGRAVLSFVSWAAGQAATYARAVMDGLIAAGKSVAAVMSEIVRQGVAAVRTLVGALYSVVKKVGAILAAAALTIGSVVRTVFEGLFMVGVGLVEVVKGVFTDVVAGFRRGLISGLMAIGKGVLDIFVAALAAGAAILGLAVAAVFELLGGYRPLTAAEIVQARRVFGWSIDLGRVKVATASIAADIANWLNDQRPFTTMYLINFSSSAHITMATLIHELTHVWQAVVAGPIYMVEALHSQVFGRGYEVTDAEVIAANGDFSKFEREQQAVIVERYWQALSAGDIARAQFYQPLASKVYRRRPVSIATLVSPSALPLNRRAPRPPRLILASAD